MKKDIILVCGDIHGRKFWKEPCKNIDNYNKIVFLGDYLDPYDFEKISVKDAIENFKEIIDFKKKHMDKVILLIGNHDCPYAFKSYYGFSTYHCRHSIMHHNEIHKLFNENIDLFQIAYAYKDILFTHAGVESEWLDKIVECKETDLNKICEILNNLTSSIDGLKKLYKITPNRGGRDRQGSCVWTDVHNMMWDVIERHKDKDNFKQIFGHTLQAYYDKDRNIAYGNPIEFENCKMVDNAKPYLLNVDEFIIEDI